MTGDPDDGGRGCGPDDECGCHDHGSHGHDHGGHGGSHDHGHGGHDHGSEPDGPPDPQLAPERSPGFGEDPGGLSDIEVSRDVTIGEATPEELMASDTSPVDGEPTRVLLERVRTGSAVQRRRAALALADADDPEDRVAETLAGVARTDDDPDVRQFAVEALGKLGGEVAESGALAVTHDEEPWVRAEAVVSLDRLDRAAHADRLDRAIEDDHHAVRRNALISLFKLRGEALEEELLAAMEDPSERVREWAAHMLAGIDDERARQALERAARTDDSGVVRTTAANALGRDPDRFRRSFRDALSESETLLPGEDLLNRQPDL